MRQTTRRATVPLLAMLISTAGCGADAPSAEADRAALETVQSTVGQRMELEMEDELYVNARLLPGPPPSVAEMERVYQDFFFLPDGTRRDSDYVYLNVYDADHRFQYQLVYDPRQERIVRGGTEHY